MFNQRVYERLNGMRVQAWNNYLNIADKDLRNNWAAIFILLADEMETMF